MWACSCSTLLIAWGIAAIWLWLIFNAHRHDQTERAPRGRPNEDFLKFVLTAFSLWLGIQSLLTGEPLAPTSAAARDGSYAHLGWTAVRTASRPSIPSADQHQVNNEIHLQTRRSIVRFFRTLGSEDSTLPGKRKQGLI
jgi:hypothetical protein